MPCMMRRGLLLLGALSTNVILLAGGAEAQAGSSAQFSATSAVVPGGRVEVKLALHLPADTCRLQARSGRRWRTLSVVNPEQTSLEWSWRVAADARAATWHLRVACESEYWSSELRVHRRSHRPSALKLVAGSVRFRESGAALPSRPAESTGKGDEAPPSEPAPSATPSEPGGGTIFSLAYGECTDWAYHERPDIYDDRSPQDSDSNWDAWTWAEHARLEGLTVNETPEVGAIAVWPISESSPIGHVAYVEVVNPAGDDGQGEIIVSEMNDAGVTQEEMRYYEGIWPYDIKPIQDPSGEDVSYIHQR